MEVITLKHKTVNAYVINTNDLIIMVDAGYPESMNIYTKLLTNINTTFSQIKYLIITHFHPDHAGLVQQLLDYENQLLLHKAQKGYLEWINNHFEKHIHKKYKPIIVGNNENKIILDTEESKMLFKKNKIEGKIISTLGHTDEQYYIYCQ